MENERELLEMAANACGMTVYEALSKLGRPINLYSRWSPATDDGDCGRLEAELGIDIEWLSYEVCAYLKDEEGMLLHEESELYSDHKGDKQAARRMASLRVAAEIGRAMQSDKR